MQSGFGRTSGEGGGVMCTEDEDWPDDYTPTKFCWHCGKKLWGAKRVIKVVEGLPRTLHKRCKKYIDKALKEGEHE